jgi:hypothetical protein
MLGAKRVETRSWRPPEALIRQRVAIHAAKRLDPIAFAEPFIAALDRGPSSLPLGALLGSVVLEGAWHIDHPADARMIAQEYHRVDDHRGAPVWDEPGTERELAFGDYRVGRWAWGLGYVRVLDRPIPFVGRQRLFEIDFEELLA